MRKRSSALAVGVLVLGLLAAGCGGGGSSGGSGGDATAQQVDVKCKAANSKVAVQLLNTLRKAKPKSEQEEIHLEVTQWVPVLIAGAEAELLAIESLEVPEGKQAEVKRILDAYRQWMLKARSRPFKVVVANDVYKQARELAKKYGLADCGEDPFEIMRHLE